MQNTAPVMISSPRQAPGGLCARPTASATATPSTAMPTPVILRAVSRSTPSSAPTTMVWSGNVASARLARASVVKLWRHLLAVALGLVVVDPELRLLLVERVGDLLHRRRAQLLAGVHAGNAAIVPI